MPKTFKIILPGEMLEEVYEHVFPNGEVVVVEKTSKPVVPSKKNQQRIAVNKETLKPMLIPSAQHEAWEKINRKKFSLAADKMAAAGYSIPLVRAKCKILFYFPDSKTRDLGNKLETIADIMKFTGIILDDAFQVFNPLTLVGYIQRDQPRTEIYITMLTPDMAEYEVDKTPPAYYEARKARSNLLRRIKADKKRQGIIEPVAPPEPSAARKVRRNTISRIKARLKRRSSLTGPKIEPPQ